MCGLPLAEIYMRHRLKAAKLIAALQNAACCNIKKDQSSANSVSHKSIHIKQSVVYSLKVRRVVLLFISFNVYVGGNNGCFMI